MTGFAQAKPAVCGLNLNLTNIADSATYSVKIAAYMIVEDTDKENCKKVLKVLSEAQKGNSNFEKMIKDITTEAKFASKYTVDIKKMRLNWLQDCGRATHGFFDGEFVDVCTNLEQQKLYLVAIHKKPTIKKLVLDKKLDNDQAYEELKKLIN